MDGLSEETAYTVKIYAFSPVGRSDVTAYSVKTLAVSAAKPENPVVTPGENDGKQDTVANQTGIPQTGDSGNILFWIAAALVSTAGAIILAIASDRKKQTK